MLCWAELTMETKAWNSVHSLLQGCSHLEDLKSIRQAYLLSMFIGVTSVSHVADHLIRLFTACESLSEAEQVFCKVAKPTVYTWHAIISAHMKLGKFKEGLDLYFRMKQEDIKPNKFIFLCVLKICSNVKEAKEGRRIHDEIIRLELDGDTSIRNTLVDLYSKCGSLEEACHVFDRLQEKDMVSWGAMIAGYAAHDLGVQGLEAYKKMWQEGFAPNSVHFLCTLRACGSIGALEQGRLLHGQIMRDGIQLDDVVGSALIDMYLKCGSPEDADNVFECLPTQDVVSWGVMIQGYAEQGHGEIALLFYEGMQAQGIKPTKLTYLGALKACGVLGAVGQGRLMHIELILDHLESDLVIGNALVDMYAKCGSIDEARKVFDHMPIKDGISFNSAIQGYVQQDLCVPALLLYSEMQQKGMKANKVTFPTVLRACWSIRALVEGRQLHDEILRREFESELMIQSALVDMYAKCGGMEEARKVFDAIEVRDVASWGTILAGYAQCGDWSMARQSFIDMQSKRLKPDEWMFSSILTACSHAGEVEEGRWYFDNMVHEYGMKPTVDHFNCIIDLHGRAGRLEEARDIIQSIPAEVDVSGWTSLLTSCEKYGNKDLGNECFSEATWLDTTNASGFVIMSNIFSDSHITSDVSDSRISVESSTDSMRMS